MARKNTNTGTVIGNVTPVDGKDYVCKGAVKSALRAAARVAGGKWGLVEKADDGKTMTITREDGATLTARREAGAPVTLVGKVIEVEAKPAPAKVETPVKAKAKAEVPVKPAPKAKAKAEAAPAPAPAKAKPAKATPAKPVVNGAKIAPVRDNANLPF